jgi:hypothetical protein
LIVAGKRRAKVPLDEIRSRYPSLSALAAPLAEGESPWSVAFKARPDAMHALLADFIKQAYATPGRIGQRPMPKEEQVDFKALIYGEENEQPLVEVLPRLVKTDMGSFARSVHMSRTQCQRMFKGEYHPTVAEIRLIANAVGKPPTFFIEYRNAMVILALINLFDERPGIATSLYRKYLEVRMEG